MGRTITESCPLAIDAEGSSTRLTFRLADASLVASSLFDTSSAAGAREVCAEATLDAIVAAGGMTAADKRALVGLLRQVDLHLRGEYA